MKSEILSSVQDAKKEAEMLCPDDMKFYEILGSAFESKIESGLGWKGNKATETFSQECNQFLRKIIQ